MVSDESNASTETPNEDGAPAETSADVSDVDPAETDAESDAPRSEKDGDEAPDSTDEEKKSVTDVETIVVDPEEILRSVAYNGQEDIGEKAKGKVVFSLTPPFEEPVEPTVRHLKEDSREGKADGEIHIRPFRFVFDGRKVIDQRPTRRLATSKLAAEEPSESAIEAWVDEAMETWKEHVRENLVESVDIYSPHGMAFIDVEYRENE